MGDTSIEWTEKTWNPVTGCTKVSPGCAHCYAEGVADRFWATQYPPVTCAVDDPRVAVRDAVRRDMGLVEPGGYFNNLGSLRSLGLIDYPSPGTVAAKPILFLEGRR